jgi:hypothetical protein
MEPWMTDPRVLLVGVSAVDAALVAALCWTVGRLRKERTTAQAEQRETLERLRADLAGLVVDADARSRALDGQLEVRETRLRSLLDDIGSTETWALDASGVRRAWRGARRARQRGPGGGAPAARSPEGARAAGRVMAAIRAGVGSALPTRALCGAAAARRVVASPLLTKALG